jgi:hypothetical protein
MARPFAPSSPTRVILIIATDLAAPQPRARNPFADRALGLSPGEQVPPISPVIVDRGAEAKRTGKGLHMHIASRTATDDEPTRGPWIWAATIIAIIACLSMSSLLAPVANQGATRADATLDIPVGP